MKKKYPRQYTQRKKKGWAFMTVSLTPDQRKRVGKFAKDCNTSVSEWIRRQIDLFSTFPMNKPTYAYILVDRKPVLAETWYQVDKWLQDYNRRRINFTVRGEISISTMFTVMDLSNSLFANAPQLFETLIMKNSIAIALARCETWEQAIEMHQKACDFYFPKEKLK